MATSSIPAAIDYLVAQAKLLPAFASPAAVSDGWPDQRGARGLAVGVTPEDGETENAPVWAEVGARAQWENYQIPCILWAYVGGSDTKAARDAAFALYNALNTMLLGDPSLGNALNSGSAILANIRVHQTSTASEAGDGRACDIRFDVACNHRLAA